MLEGDKDAFITIYHTNYRALFQYGFTLTKDKDLTKDCLQELFLEIWNTRGSINKEVADIKSYLFTWFRRKISRTIYINNRNRSVEQHIEQGENEQASYEDLLIAFQTTERKKAKLVEKCCHSRVITLSFPRNHLVIPA